MPTPDNFHIFSLLPPEARVHVVLGDGGVYQKAGQAQEDLSCSTSAAEAEAAIRAAVESICDLRKSWGSFDNDTARRARCIYARNEEARVEFPADHELEGLELRIWCGGEGALKGHEFPDVLANPWVFVGARYEMPYCRPKDGPARIEKVAAFLKTLPFVENDL